MGERRRTAASTLVHFPQVGEGECLYLVISESLVHRRLLGHGCGSTFWRELPEKQQTPKPPSPPGGGAVPRLTDRSLWQFRSCGPRLPNASEKRSLRATAEFCLCPSPSCMLRHATG